MLENSSGKEVVSKNQIYPADQSNNDAILFNRDGKAQSTKGKKKKNSPDEQSNAQKRNVKLKRQKKQQHCVLYWGNIFSILLISLLNIPLFLLPNPLVVMILMVFVIVTSSAFFLVGSCKLAQTVKDMCGIYFIMDSIFLAFCTADIGFIGMLTISFPPGEPTSIVISIILTINLFLFSGNSRVIIAYVKYKRWETIVLKITIILGLLDYLVLAAYFMRNSFSAIPLSPDVVENFQEFFFLYIFGMFTLYMQVFTKISDLDGTGDIQYHYTIDEEDSYEEVWLKEQIEEEKNEINQTEIKGKENVRVNQIQSMNDI